MTDCYLQPCLIYEVVNHIVRNNKYFFQLVVVIFTFIHVTDDSTSLVNENS